MYCKTIGSDYDFDLSLNQVLKDVDGIVFVADSQDARFDVNVEVLEGMAVRLAALGCDLARMPGLGTL